MKRLNLPTYSVNLKSERGDDFIFDDFRKKWVTLTPEEWVRQHFSHYLSDHLGYPASLMVIEKMVVVNDLRLRCDLMIHDRSGSVIMLIECKAPEVPLSQEVFRQVASYNSVLKVPYLVITNGMDHFCAHLDHQSEAYRFLSEIPDYERLIQSSRIN